MAEVKQTWRYKLLKRYLRWVHETLMVRHRYTIGMERMPHYGERFFIVCNHQNTANDPLNIVFTLPVSWHVCAMARANVFSVRPFITRFLHWIGLLPAYRLGWEGGEGLDNNFDSFDHVADSVNSGYPLIVFPEAGHTQGHYLDRFTSGSVRMAFHTAAANGFREEVKIVPTAHHYSDYFDIHTDFLWTIGEPISLKPYYEAYREHPNGVMRDITRQLRSTIRQMMLDEGADDYEAKDFLRQSALNTERTDDMPLPQQMQADQRFIDRLRQHPQYADIIRMAQQLAREEQLIGTDDLTIEHKPNAAATLLRLVLLAVLLPLWIVSLWPHIVCYSLPPRFIKSDKMFVNSYRFIMSVLFLYPLLAVLTFLVVAPVTGWWWQTLLWIALWIPIGRFSWWYYTVARQTRRELNRLIHPQAVKHAEQLREKIRNILYE